MTREEAKVGSKVRSLRAFAGVPQGTVGLIVQDYGIGVVVAWDLPDAPLPVGYKETPGVQNWSLGIVRDGFFKKDELQFLELVEANP